MARLPEHIRQKQAICPHEQTAEVYRMYGNTKQIHLICKSCSKFLGKKKWQVYPVDPRSDHQRRWERQCIREGCEERLHVGRNGLCWAHHRMAHPHCEECSEPVWRYEPLCEYHHNRRLQTSKKAREWQKKSRRKKQMRVLKGKLVFSEVANSPIPPLKSLWHGMGKWARDYDACEECSRNMYRHAGKGLCIPCYAKQYREAKMLYKHTSPIKGLFKSSYDPDRARAYQRAYRAYQRRMIAYLERAEQGELPVSEKMEDILRIGDDGMMAPAQLQRSLPLFYSSSTSSSSGSASSYSSGSPGGR